MRQQLNTDINTTPLVDVMLVMLIIFLVTIPVIVKSIPVQLPTYRNIVTVTKPENIVIAVDGNENIYWNNDRRRRSTEPELRDSTDRCAESRHRGAQEFPGSAYPRRQECALRGGGPGDPGLPAGGHPEGGLHHRTATSWTLQQLSDWLVCFRR